jgi:hypothetical protein
VRSAAPQRRQSTAGEEHRLTVRRVLALASEEQQSNTLWWMQDS